MEEIYVDISRKIIYERYKILLIISDSRREWSIKICMYQFEDVQNFVGFKYNFISLFSLYIVNINIKIYKIEGVKNFI